MPDFRSTWIARRDTPQITGLAFFLTEQDFVRARLNTWGKSLGRVCNNVRKLDYRPQIADLSNDDLVAAFRWSQGMGLAREYMDEIEDWERRLESVPAPQGVPAWGQALLVWLLDTLVCEDDPDAKVIDFLVSISLCFHYALACHDEVVQRGLKEPLVLGVLGGEEGIKLLVLHLKHGLWPLISGNQVRLKDISPETQEEMTEELEGLWEGICFWKNKPLIDIFQAASTKRLRASLLAAAKHNQIDLARRQGRAGRVASLDKLLEGAEHASEAQRAIAVQATYFHDIPVASLCPQCCADLPPAQRTAVQVIENKLREGYALGSKRGQSMRQAFKTNQEYERIMRNFNYAAARLKACPHK